MVLEALTELWTNAGELGKAEAAALGALDMYTRRGG